MKWTALGESVAGTSHRARGVPCQDAFRYRTFGAAGEWLVIATADGAGSASHSEMGATFTCDEFIRRVESTDPDALFDRDGMIGLFSDVRTALFATAERLDIRPRDLACTALLAVVGPTSAAFAQIGDGAIVYGEELSHQVAFWPEPAEYVNATDFLTDDQFPDTIRFHSVDWPVSEVATFTDGLQRLALDFTTRSAHPGFFAPVFRELRNAADPELLLEPFRSFLDSDRVNERTDDDKTLVLAVRL
jgi:hypothetical protein